MSVAEPTGAPTVYAVPPSKAPWRLHGAAVVNGSASGYFSSRVLAPRRSPLHPVLDVSAGPSGGLAWAVSGAGNLGGVYTSAQSGVATRVPFPITQATALEGLSNGTVATGVLVGDASGDIRSCDYSLKSCGTPIHLPSSARIDWIGGEGSDVYALAAVGIYVFHLLPVSGGTANGDLTTPTLVRQAKTAAIVDGGVEYRHEMAVETKCVFFSSADGLGG